MWGLRAKAREEAVRGGRLVFRNRPVGLFLSREAMLAHLETQYERAASADVIWGQCIGCSAYSPDVQGQILAAAGRGVEFKLIVNRNAPAIDDFLRMYLPISAAAIVGAVDNTLRIHGLSDSEVVIGFSAVGSFSAVLINDRHAVNLVKAWFDKRFDALDTAGARVVPSHD